MACCVSLLYPGLLWLKASAPKSVSNRAALPNDEGQLLSQAILVICVNTHVSQCEGTYQVVTEDGTSTTQGKIKGEIWQVLECFWISAVSLYNSHIGETKSFCSKSGSLQEFLMQIKTPRLSRFGGKLAEGVVSSTPNIKGTAL
jgi:hypothetical protein